LKKSFHGFLPCLFCQSLLIKDKGHPSFRYLRTKDSLSFTAFYGC
jgi:hypothetical protein